MPFGKGWIILKLLVNIAWLHNFARLRQSHICVVDSVIHDGAGIRVSRRLVLCDANEGGVRSISFCVRRVATYLRMRIHLSIQSSGRTKVGAYCRWRAHRTSGYFVCRSYLLHLVCFMPQELEGWDTCFWQVCLETEG